MCLFTTPLTTPCMLPDKMISAFETNPDTDTEVKNPNDPNHTVGIKQFRK